MGDTTISWTHRPGFRARSWNPTQGCEFESAGCHHCYAMRMANRFAQNGWSKGLIDLNTGKWNGETRLAAHKLIEPLTWTEPSTVFVNSMSDLFFGRLSRTRGWRGFTNEQIAAVFGVMVACPQHTFIILTKRPGRMREWFEWAMSQMIGNQPMRASAVCTEAAAAAMPSKEHRERLGREAWKAIPVHWPLPNVWLGTSIENQHHVDRIEELAQVPAAVRLVSCEPLIGSLALGLLGTLPAAITGGGYVMTHERIHWVIAGAESGPGARTCEVDWLRELRDECASTETPFFLKQAVAKDAPDADRPIKLGKGSNDHGKVDGWPLVELPYLDGVQHAAFPHAPTWTEGDWRYA